MSKETYSGGYNPLKSMEWVLDHLGSLDLLIMDCRYSLMDTEYGRSEYRKSHIPGSHFVDLMDDLTGPLGKHGGRHPLPDMPRFAARMKKLGVNSRSTVVCYDDNWSGAARLYFLLHYCSFRNVYVMNGLFQNWVEKGYPVDARIPETRQGDFRYSLDSELVISADKLKRELGHLELVDCRTNDRYRGQNETIDPVAGHIPGAKNLPFTESTHAAGYHGAEKLGSIFSGLSQNPVLYCGSGVTACVNFVAMKIAGKDPVLYAGSWSDWISYPENPVVRNK